MPKYCCVYGCNSSSSKNPNISFFKFPKDSKLSKAWIIRIRREDFTPTATSYVCSRHFLSEDFTSSNSDTPDIFKKIRLMKEAVPSVNLRGQESDERISSRPVRARLSGASDELSLPQANFDLDASPTTSNLASSSRNCEVKDFTRDEQNQELLERIRILERKLFRYNNLLETEIKSYTGIDKGDFEVVAKMIARFFPLKYWSGKPVTSISHQDQILICCMKLKLDLPYFDLAKRYAVSQTTIQNIFMTYLYAMHQIFFLGSMTQLPSQNKNKASLPDSFGDFSNCRVIID